MDLETYVDSMLKSFVVQLTISKFSSRTAMLNQEDLEQHARIVLMEVFQNYPGKPESELRRIGNRAVKNQLRDIYHAEHATTRGGVGTRVLRGRTKRRPDQYEAIMVDIDDYDQRQCIDDDANDRPVPVELQHAGDQLKRQEIREKVEKIMDAASEIERRTLRMLLNAEARPRGLRSQTFKSLQRKLRNIA